MKNILSFLLAICCSTINVFAQNNFVQNKGQWPSKVLFKTDYQTGAFFLQQNGFTILQHHPQDYQNIAEAMHGQSHDNENNEAKNNKPALRSHAYFVEFLGALTPTIISEKLQAQVSNYAIGENPANWQSNCKEYGAILYQNIYPNIDVRFYTENDNLKYDFIVRPGGNPAEILLKYNGADKLSIKNNELIIATSVGDNKEQYPYTYQNSAAGRQEVSCKFKISDDVVSFKVNNYNTNQTLVIDPTLIFCTFSGSRANNYGYTATPGTDGTFFGGGIVFASGFPTTIGPVFQSTVAESYDMGIIKLSADGATRQYATYIGGNDSEQPHSMIADAAGNLFIAGRSRSNNFPITFTDVAQLGPRGDYDIVIVKLAPNGALLNSIKMGGTGQDGVNVRDKLILPSGTESLRRNYGDDARSEILLDASGSLLVASCTRSTASGFSDAFPTKNAVQTTFGGGNQDGVVIKVNAAMNNILFSSFFGGNGDDACFVLAINPQNNNLLIAGATASNNLLGNKTGVYQPTAQGDIDGFVTEWNNNGNTILKTTYMGTPGVDLVYGIQFGKNGDPYIMGTSSGSWPILNAMFSNPGAKQFIAKLRPDLSGLVYSTVFGTSSSNPNISPVAFLVDRCENVYVSGWGGSVNTRAGYPSAGTLGMPAVAALPGIPSPDGSDFYFIVIERNATRQLFGSHFGKQAVAAPPTDYGEHVDGGTSRFDQNGVIYQAVCGFGGGARFPTTAGSWSPNAGTRAFNLAMIKIEMNFGGVGATIQPRIGNTRKTAVCQFETVTFIDTLAQGKSYLWNFGDGSPQITTTAPNNSVTHSYALPGTYRAFVVALDPATCNERDTAFTIIRVGNNRITPSFTINKVGGCNTLDFRFTNLSTADDPSGFNARTFTWDFGDGTPTVTQNLNPPIIHTFPAAGTYNIRLSVTDSLFCNAPVVLDSVVRISPIVEARFTTPATGCRPYTASFVNTSLGGLTFDWDWGDGTPLERNNLPTVTHIYPNVGTYNVRLIARDPNTCNLIDTSDVATIRVVNAPTAAFTWGPIPVQANSQTNFTNQSLGAIRYEWFFGDGETSELVNPSHQYKLTDSFNVELIAYNAEGCSAIARQTVAAIVNPLLDVPTGFTPGKFGVNAIIKVLGFGIEQMDWRIYNRFGQLVFRTNDPAIGWDGTFKGQLQAMDTYTYTLSVVFGNGTKVTKTGDITLLR
jgi:gliding motility-associated-like protein